MYPAYPWSTSIHNLTATATLRFKFEIALLPVHPCNSNLKLHLLPVHIFISFEILNLVLERKWASTTCRRDFVEPVSCDFVHLSRLYIIPVCSLPCDLLHLGSISLRERSPHICLPWKGSAGTLSRVRVYLTHFIPLPQKIQKRCSSLTQH